MSSGDRGIVAILTDLVFDRLDQALRSRRNGSQTWFVWSDLCHQAAQMIGHACGLDYGAPDQALSD